MSVVGTISIMPSAYGRSICSFGDSGAASGSMRDATITELVVEIRRPEIRAPVIVCLTTDTFGAGAFFCGAASAPSSRRRRRSVPAVTVNARLNRVVARCAAHGHEVDVLDAHSGGAASCSLSSFLSSFFAGRGQLSPSGRRILRDDAPVERDVRARRPSMASKVTVNGTYSLVARSPSDSLRAPTRGRSRSSQADQRRHASTILTMSRSLFLLGVASASCRPCRFCATSATEHASTGLCASTSAQAFHADSQP